MDVLTPGLITDIKKFFDPVSTEEFSAFWQSLTEAEKDEFKRQVVIANFMRE